MRITKISVKGLFGMFDHEIPLNQESRITIVHGPNGVGKTVLMQMVHGLFNYNYKWIGDLPFDELRIEFDGKEFITVGKLLEQERLFIEYTDSAGERHSTPFAPKTDLFVANHLRSAVENELPDYKQFWVGGASYWADVFYPDDTLEYIKAILDNDTDALESYENLRRFDVLAENELLEKYSQIHDTVFGARPDWFDYIRMEVDVGLILTQRLVSHTLDEEEVSDMFGYGYDDVISGPQAFPKVWEFSERISLRFRNALVSMFEESAGIDFETHVRELIHVIQSHEEYQTNEELQAMPTYRLAQEVRKFVLNRTKEDIEPAHKRGDLMEEIAVFKSVINERILFKQLTIDEEDGFKLINDAGEEIDPSDLSSGEQQLLVLYYQLLFEIEPDTLVMIDEPELSMNVVWQRNFLKDLQRIIELRNFDVLIATHSPQIFHDKWDWVVHLGEKVDD